MQSTDREHMNDTPPAGDAAMSLEEYQELLLEIEDQPHWRAIADKEMDYADGNQLDGDLLRKQAELGIPPAVEDVIGPTLLSLQGYEATTRTDWRVTPNGEPGGQDVADALNYRLNQAERQSKADRACSEAFRPQVGCGLGWVEVARESDPFKFAYRCSAIRRHEIHWDMKAQEPDLSDARFLRRMRWMTPDRLAMVFPQHADLLQQVRVHGPAWWGELDIQALEGGTSTGLNNAWNEARSWTITEDRWYNPTSREVCVVELWYRRWVQVYVMRTPDGRVVEYDENNLAHNIALASGTVSPKRATVARVRRAYWLGPHCLHDGPSPYTHRHFPYVPFFGFREDSTGVPYGYVRSMKYAQDSLNSGQSKLRWGMSVVRVERTDGAVDMTDAQLRKQVARPDADIKLNAEHFSSNPGARFEVHRDYQLTDQHYQLLNDNRATIERVSGITASFQGRQGTARSGVQEQTQAEQSNQSLGRMMDNFRAARTQVGELLLAMIIEDIGSAQTEVVIEGDAVREDRTVVLNAPERDPATGAVYLSNDLQRTRLKVALEDVPSSSSYRSQQLQALTEAIKPLPPEYLAAAIPFLASLMDVPFKRDLVEAFRAVGTAPTPEDIEQQIQQALTDAGNDIKLQELELKRTKQESEIKGLDAKTLLTVVQAMFSSMQAGGQIAMNPAIAPIADEVMKGAGYQRPSPGGVDPNFPTLSLPTAESVATPQGEIAEVHTNTSPAFPPVPDDGQSAMEGIETIDTSDNLSGATA